MEKNKKQQKKHFPPSKKKKMFKRNTFTSIHTSLTWVLNKDLHEYSGLNADIENSQSIVHSSNLWKAQSL